MAIFLEIKVYAVEIASTLVFVAFIARDSRSERARDRMLKLSN